MLLGCSGRAQEAQSVALTQETAAAPFEAEPDTTPRPATLLFIGDVMQHMPQITAAWDSAKATYDYSSYFKFLGPQIAAADVAVCNFEVTLGGKPYSGYPTFSAPDEYFEAVMHAGFDVFLTANNHCLDKGQKGLERTIAKMRDAEVAHLGTYEDSIDRVLRYPDVYLVNNLRIVFLNYTYGTNGLKTRGGNVVNYIDRQVIRADLDKARELTPDYIICCVHWGVEYQTVPNEEQKSLAKWLIDNGVDHVIGGHPYVVQPFEVITTADTHKHLVAYSLGNFVSNQNKPNTTGGMVVGLTLDPSDYNATVASAWWEAFSVAKPKVSGCGNYVAVPTWAEGQGLPASQHNAAEAFAASLRKILAKGDTIQERKSRD